MSKLKDPQLFFHIGLLIFAVLVAIFFFVIPARKADRYFVDSEYSGVINAIEYRPGYRNSPHILLDSTWKLLTLDEHKVEQHLQVGDSVVKEKGRTITIYKKVNGSYTKHGVY
jgi:hypothetical protein